MPLTYIETHRDQFLKHLRPAFLQSVEIELLVRSGQIQTAQERLQALKNALEPDAFRRLSSIVAAGTHADPLAFHEQQFIETDSLPDLVVLVDRLQNARDSTRLTKYGGILFGRTKDFPTFRVYCMALYETGQFQAAVEQLRSHQEFVTRSNGLRSIFAWSLFYLGQLVECRTVLFELRTLRDSPDDRNLVVSLAITSGEWNSLASFVEVEWERRAERQAPEILRAAQIAYQLGATTRARQLLVEAATNANDDAQVLLGCYSTAMSAGWEDQESFKWIERAAQLSDEHGPVQKFSLKQVLELQPDWQRRENQAWERFHAVGLPIVGFANMLNRSLVEIALLPALGNAVTIDPRRRMSIYSYSGNRQNAVQPKKSIAMDPTALLNAGMLAIIDRIVDNAEKVVIPHSTLSWLFEEKQKIHFHQPSKVADARELKRLIDANVLKRFEPTISIDETLGREIGEELAILFAEAEAAWDGDERPRKVVRSSPIHRLASLMEEEADLGTHAGTLVSCLDVIDALVAQGRLTQIEEQRSRAFLKLQDRTTPGASRVEPGTVLYLDSVSLAHFQHLDLLAKFEASGFAVMIEAGRIREADQIIRYEALTERAQIVIEETRRTLAAGISSGKVVVADRLSGDEENAAHHPAIDAIRVSASADCLVIDDRYFNRHLSVTHNDGTQTLVTTTFDWIASHGFSEEERANLLANARSSGLSFVPVMQEELEALLKRSSIRNGKLVETAELRSLRENLLLCRMSTGLKLPDENGWFDSTQRTLIDSIKNQWRADQDEAAASARSDWLLTLLDVRGWADRYRNQNLGMSRLRFVGMLKTLMLVDKKAPATVRRAYWQWLETSLLETVRERDAALYGELISDLVRLIESLVQRHGKLGSDVG